MELNWKSRNDSFWSLASWPCSANLISSHFFLEFTSDDFIREVKIVLCQLGDFLMAWLINLLKSQNSYNWVLVILTSFSVLVLDQAALVWPINCRDSVSAFHPGVLGSNLSSPVRQVVILCCLEKGTASKQNSYQHCKNKVTSLTRYLFGRTSLPSHEPRPL